MAEFLDIVDASGAPTGETVERTFAHQNGIPHRTAHVWLTRKNGTGHELLLQKRSDNKDSYPGCYDISSAGHIPAGDEVIDSALRELSEELGITADAEDLIDCGKRTIHMDAVFYGKEFHDRQVSTVYLLKADPKEFCLQKEEVSEVRWFDITYCIDHLADPAFPNCLVEEELRMLEPFLD